MKILKTIAVVLLNLILFNLLMVFAISLNLESMVKDDILKEIIKEEFLNDEIKSNSSEITTDNEKINELLERPETQEIVDKYLDITIDSLTDENKVSEVEIEKDMINFLKENKELVKEKLDVEVTDEMINSVEKELENKELSTVFKKSLTNAKETMPKEAKLILQAYNYLISLKFKLIIALFILIDILLIALLQSSVYKWLSSLGGSAVISGIGLLIMSLIVKIVVTSFSNFKGFNLNSLTTTGFILIAIGIILIIVKKLLEKKSVKEDVHEVSEISSAE